MICYCSVSLLVYAALFVANGMASAAPRSEPALGPSESQLADAVRLGTVATLAPLCGLRDEPWAEDLRRATVQSATGAKAYDDPALKAAPGSNLAIGALSFAEMEALEDFAEPSGASSCGRLAADPELARADDIVRAFRDQLAPVPRS
ncbi:MAG: hypothetical protein JO110_22565 [Acetobacteraceae bacterium]|nr:hypothetical protein [Acetobacteraceae bacterium]